MKKSLFARLVSIVTSISFLFLLAACSGVTSAPTSTNAPAATSTTTPTPATTPTPTTTPTSEAAATPTSTPTPATNGLQTYTVPDFTVGYPNTWSAQAYQHDTVVIISYPGYKANFNVSANKDTGLNTTVSLAQAIADALVNLKNEHKNLEASNPKNITIAGETWQSFSWTGINKSTGSKFKGNFAVTIHNGKRYTLDYSAYVDNFDQAYTIGFKPMEQSFAFKG